MFWFYVQISGVGAMVAGIALEAYTRCDWCFIAITTGSLLFALAEKYIHHTKKKRKLK